MNDNIGQVIQDALKIPEINAKCLLENKLTYAEKDKREKSLSQVINYCILFRSYDGLKDYMKTPDKNKSDFLVRRIATVLNIKYEDIETRFNDVFNYVFNSFQVNGYVFHSTNSFFAEQMKLNGLSPNNPNKEEFDYDILRISKIFKKYGSFNPLGWGLMDIQNGKNGWFYDEKSESISYYCNGPEWFNQFCGCNPVYINLIENEKRYGYANRNYSDALECINFLIKNKNIGNEDSKIILEFFNKYWSMFEYTKPTVVLIPQKCLTPFTKEREETLFDIYYKTYSDKKELIDNIAKGKGCSNASVNMCSYETVPAELLSFIDLSDVIVRRKGPEETNVLSDAIKLLQGFDASKLQEAFNILQQLEEGKIIKENGDEEYGKAI